MTNTLGGSRQQPIGSDVSAPADTLTILRTLGTVENPDGTRRPRLATKRVELGDDGEPVTHGYDKARTFAVEEVPVDGIASLAATVAALQSEPRACVIRGAPLPGIDRGHTRRLLHEKLDPETGEVHQPTFQPQARRWLLVDSDGLLVPRAFDWRDGALSALWLVRHLPQALEGCSLAWSFTAGAGFKPTLRLHLLLWLDRAISDAEAAHWLAGTPAADPALYSPVQPHYTAAPIIGPGVPDPLDGWPRCGFLEGFRDVVPVPEIRVPAPAAPVDPLRPASDPARPYDHRRRYALAALAGEAEALAGTAVGGGRHGRGRHHALVVAALKMGRFVATGELTTAETTAGLVAAARLAGLTDPWPELVRHVANGLTAAGRSAAA